MKLEYFLCASDQFNPTLDGYSIWSEIGFKMAMRDLKMAFKEQKYFYVFLSDDYVEHAENSRYVAKYVLKSGKKICAFPEFGGWHNFLVETGQSNFGIIR